MAQTVQILRSNTNTPPGVLLAGSLSAELGSFTKLWIGSPSGNRLLLSGDPGDSNITIGAPINNPIFTGNPQAPTPPPGDNDSSIATTAFVTELAGHYLPLVGGTLSGNITITSTTSAGVGLNKNAGAFSNNLVGYRASVPRWNLEVGNGIVEAGGDSGSDFTISRYNDAGAYLSSPVQISRATGIMTVTALNATQYNIGGKVFATSDGATTSIWGTSGATIHLQAATNYYDADTHVFRSNTGLINTAVLDSVGNLTLHDAYIHFEGSTGVVNTTGGPLIYADTANHVYKLGAGNANWLFQDYAGTNVATLNASGGLALSSTLTAPNVTISGAISASSVQVSGPNAVYGFYDRDGVSQPWSWYATGGTARLWNGVNSDRVTVDAGGSMVVDGEIVAGGNLHAGGGLFLGNPYVLFNNNLNLSQGPYMSVDNTNWVTRLGVGNGVYFFQNSAGSSVVTIDAGGSIGAAGYVASLGYQTRAGIAGAATGNHFNVEWPGAHLWIDNVHQGSLVLDTGGISTSNVYSSGGFFTTDANGGPSFVIYSPPGANASFIQFLVGWYLHFNAVGGQLAWVADSNFFWMMRYADHTCLNNLGPVAGVGAYINLSDRRGKKNIAPSQRGLAEIMELTPVEFDRITTIDTPREIGFIAQDVIGVLPEAVRVVGMTLPDGTGGLDDMEPSLGLTDSTIVAALVNAVKTLNTRLVALEGG